MRVARAAIVRLLTGALAFGEARSAIADDETPDATPYRPTVSTPATLSAPGWLESESGAIVAYRRDAPADASHRASLPYAVKYAFTEDWGVRVAGEALVRARDDDGVRRTGFGDTSLIAKRRFALDEDSALGLEAGVLAPSAGHALHLGSGKPDWSTNGIYSVNVAGWHADVNTIVTRMGAREEGVGRWQGQGALALSHPLGGRWSAVSEWSGTGQRGASPTAQFLGALSYAQRRGCVIDVGFTRGLNRASTTWQAFAGVTLVLGRLD